MSATPLSAAGRRRRRGFPFRRRGFPFRRRRPGRAQAPQRRCVCVCVRERAKVCACPARARVRASCVRVCVCVCVRVFFFLGGGGQTGGSEGGGWEVRGKRWGVSVGGGEGGCVVSVCECVRQFDLDR